MNKSTLVVLAAMLVGAAFVADRALLAAAPPEITTLLETRDFQTDQPQLVVMGSKLTKVTVAEIFDDASGATAGIAAIRFRGKTMLTLGLPPGLVKGSLYRVELTLKGKTAAGIEASFVFTDGGVLAGRVDCEALDPGLIGTGLREMGNSVQVDFGGTGTSNESARADHTHTLVWGPIQQTDYVNDWDKELYHVVPTGSVIVGLYSYHSNDREDRRWKIFYRTVGVQ